ncbi:glycosyltransferase [Paraburkholderia sediminicola]|uniref:glycosyltransferase n=1 Tax=Paraburkholderia sediminicola TaxID=458836 RepID=UPI0038BBDE27
MTENKLNRELGAKKIKIVYIVPPSRQFAGIERVVHELATQLAKDFSEYLDVHVVFCCKYKEVEYEKLLYQAHWVDAPRMRSVFFGLRQFFAKNEFDIIVPAQCEMSLFCFFAARSTRSNARIVPHLHGNPRVEKLASFTNKLIFIAYSLFVARKVAALFTVSDSLGDFVRKHLAKGKIVYTLPNPVRDFEDTARVSVSDYASDFICVARLSRQKGQDTLLKAFKLVLDKQPSLTLTLVGAGANEPELRDLADQLGVSHAVNFVGFVSDPAQYLKQARCFVLASRWEGFGVALVEALAFGLPLIVTDCEFGPSDLVSNSRLGSVVPVDDVQALAKAMSEFDSNLETEENVEFRKGIARSFKKEFISPIHFSAIMEVVGY